MISLRRSFNRTFSVDRYLDGQPQPQPVFRSWAIRLNDWIERKLDSTDFKAIELRAEKIVCSCVLSGAAIYLLFAVANAWIAGHFNFGGAR